MIAFVVSASAKVLTLDLSIVTQTRTPLSAVPRYCSLAGSKPACELSSSRGPTMAPGIGAASTVPSFGATELT